MFTAISSSWVKILQIIGKGEEQVQKDREVRQGKAGPKRGEGAQKVLGNRTKQFWHKYARTPTYLS